MTIAFSFSDRYAEAGLSPTGEIIGLRQTSATRMTGELSNEQILDLACFYYGQPDLSLTWLRDEFVKEDASFSLINNAREARVLAAILLGMAVDNEDEVAILAVVGGSVASRRHPSEAQWLVADAIAKFGEMAVARRRPSTVQPKIAPKYVLKLLDEVAAVGPNDWATLLTILAKIRNESTSAIGATASQATTALATLTDEVALLREEGQMLWWLTGGHSRTLKRPFGSLGAAQVAIIGAIELGELTTVTQLGPVAAPAILDRVIALGKRSKGKGSCELASAVDGIEKGDIQALTVHADVPPWLAPVSTAVRLAKTIGAGGWHSHFQELTGLAPATSFELEDLAKQMYVEHLLEQLYV